MTTNETSKMIGDALRAIGAGGLMGVTVAASTVTQAFDMLGALNPTIPTSKRRRCLAEIKRQGLITSSREDDMIRLQLTVKGIHRLQRLEIDELEISIPPIWDRRWRMVVFDIPLRHNDQRYIFLSQLRRLGFVMVRQSTWYHAYPCFDVIDQLVRYCNLGQFVTTAEIIRLDETTTRKLLRHFPDIDSISS